MKRWVPAPVCDNQISTSTVIGVWLDPGERVEWIYTAMPDGKRVVAGYDILPALPPEEDY